MRHAFLAALLTAALAGCASEEAPVAANDSQRMLHDNPALRGRWLEEQRRNRDRLADALRPWFGSGASPLAPHLAAGAALLALDEVMALWAEDPPLASPLGLLAQAVEILGGPQLYAVTARP